MKRGNLKEVNSTKSNQNTPYFNAELISSCVIMLPFNRNTINLRIDKNAWEDVLNKNGFVETYDDIDVIIKILKQNQRNHKTIEKLKSKLNTSSKLNKKVIAENNQLRDELRELETEQQKMKDNEMLYKNINKRDKKLETDYDNLKLKYEELKNNPIIEEKIVYKNDDKTMHALHEKNEKLRRKLWEKDELIVSLNKELKELNEKIEAVKDWKLKNYGMILKVIPKEHELIDFDLESEFINLSEYNMWLRNKREFLQNKNIDSPIHIITVGKDLLK